MQNREENENVNEEHGFISAQAGGNCFWVDDCTQPGYSCFSSYQDCIESGPWICVENCAQPQGCTCPPGFCDIYDFVPCGSGGLVSYESCICVDCTKNCGGPLQPPCPNCGKVGLPPCPQNPPGPCQGRGDNVNQGPPPAATEGAAKLKRQLTCDNINAMYSHGMAQRAKQKKQTCPNGKIKTKKTGNFYASCGQCFEDVEIVCCAKQKCQTLAEAKAENPCDNVKYLVQNGKRVLDDCGCPIFDFDPKIDNINCPDCKEPAKNTGCRRVGGKSVWVEPFCVPKTSKIVCNPCENRIVGCINGEWVERCDPKTLQGEADRLGIVCPDPFCWDLVGGCTPDQTSWIPPKCSWNNKCSSSSSSSSSSESSSSSFASSSSSYVEYTCDHHGDCPDNDPFTGLPLNKPYCCEGVCVSEFDYNNCYSSSSSSGSSSSSSLQQCDPNDPNSCLPGYCCTCQNLGVFGQYCSCEPCSSSSSSQAKWSCTGPNSCTMDPNGLYDNETACLDGAPFDCGSSSSSSGSSSSSDCPPGYRKIQTFWNPQNVFSDDQNPLP